MDTALSPPSPRGQRQGRGGLSSGVGKANATKRRHLRYEALRPGQSQSQDNPQVDELLWSLICRPL